MNEKTSWGWQLSQFQQQSREWLEYQLDRFQLNVPELPFGWSIDTHWLNNLLNLLFWLLLSLFLTWVGWQLWRQFSPHLFAWLNQTSNSTESKGKKGDYELSVAAYLGRSQEFYRQGNYREACRCLYLAMLQQLHDTSIAPHKPSRTDAEYLQLLHSSGSVMQPYETLITTHEQLCFGNQEILSDNYQQCQQAYREIGEK